jgi:hypothetical protein
MFKTIRLLILSILVCFHFGINAQIERGDYCIPTGNCTFGDGISDFVFAGIENRTSGCSPNGYGDFTNMKATVEFGDTYLAYFSSTYNNQKVSLWMDLNNDSVFSDYERFVTDLELFEAGMMYGAAVEIPLNARPGIYRLRIGSVWEVQSSPDPCAALAYGEWEDYLVEVTGDPVRTNVAVASIEMQDIMKAEPVRPWAVVINQGIDTVLSKITMREPTTGYQSTQTLWKFPPGETKWVRFDTMNLPPGKYYLSVTAELEGDEIPGDDFLSKPVVFSDQPHQKVLAEFFTGTWSSTCPNAAEGLDLLMQEFKDTLAVVAWHIGDAFENEHSLDRDAWYRIAAYPTIWFDGWQNQTGAYYPNNYHYLRPYMKQRIQQYSNYEIDIQLSETGTNMLKVNSAIRIIHGNTSENLAAFVVLTESQVSSPGNGNQQYVVRDVYPDATTGHPLDFSSQSNHIWFSQFILDEKYNPENCEIVVFLQNMDTREIYQANSRMADDITSINEMASGGDLRIYPNPAGHRFFISASTEISQVSIYNPIGKLVFETKPLSNEFIINTQNFNPGIYLVTVGTSTGTVTEKVFINLSSK